jgi:bacterial/archaeal transporter family-2 protein
VTKELALAGTVVAGGLVALQAPVNALLARITGPFGATTVNFVVGLVVLLLITFLLAGGLAAGDADEPLRWYYLLGGVLGAAYVATSLITVKTLGAGGVTAATIAGQLTAALVADRFGILGLPERTLSAPRVLGVLLLAVGTFLVVRE